VLQEGFSGDNNVNNLYGEQDAFVTRLSADGGSVVWSTYVGESGEGIIRDIDVDTAGNVYFAFTGATGDLPTPESWGPNTSRQDWDGFYGKLSADGSRLLFGNYMGGSGTGNEDGREPSVRVTPGGQVYYLTWSDKADFGCITTGAYDETINGGTDFVLAYFDTDNTLLWCTFLGGSGTELVETHGLAVDLDGNAVIAAFTDSDDIPTTPGAFQPNSGGGAEAYVAVVSPAGALLHASYFGGTGGDWAEGVAVAPNGDIVFSGGTDASPDVPRVGTQFKSTLEGREGLVVRVTPDLSSIVFSSPYGGSVRDEFRGIDVSSSGDVGIVGLTESSDFPTVNAFDSVLDADSANPDQGVTYLILGSSY
jgi:hypothetical protein